MEIKYNRILKVLIFLNFILTACNGQNSNSEKKLSTVQKIENIDFFDKKYSGELNLIIDESNISDHPFFNYLNCSDEGYFSVHFIPKKSELQNYWKNEHYKGVDFNSLDFEKDKIDIKNRLTNNYNNYNIFSYLIKKEYLVSNSKCNEESVFSKDNCLADIYFFNQNGKKWEKIKTVKEKDLPPYHDTNFFISNFPNFFKQQSEEKKDQGSTLKEFLSDLNNDGIKDKIIVYKNLKYTDKFDQEHYKLPIEIFLGTSSGFKSWKKNNDIIFSKDESCSTEGFSTISLKDSYFTIESQICYDYNISVNTYTTFKVINNEIILHKYGEEYFDKANHENKIPTKIWTTKDFGNLKFEDVLEKLLLKLRQSKPKK